MRLMLYLFIDKNRVKILNLKKSLLGQYETRFHAKSFQSALLSPEGKITNVDFLASAVKEVLQSLSDGSVKDKETLLVLPQESYSFLRIRIPSDVAASTISSFVKDKARSELSIDLDQTAYDYFFEDSSNEKFIHFFAVDNETLAKYRESLNLIDLKISKILPETVTYFKLFQKTLRKDKKENIFYVTYDDDELRGILYDSFGQSTYDKWSVNLTDKKVEEVLKTKAGEFEQKGIKLNRLILAGLKSDKIRQDTFTKEIGVWTNPLKRIIPEFYQEYLKLLISSSKHPFSVLGYEACVGAFIFSEQNKNFSLLNNSRGKTGKQISLPRINFPTKEFLIFVSSFIASFIFFIILSRSNFNFNLKPKTAKPTIAVVQIETTATPTNTPTPKVAKDIIKIKVLNGSGTPGLAGELRDILKEKGYQEILTGNADSFDYEQTELQVKKDNADVIPVLKSDLKNNVTAFKESVLPETDAADVVIIIGSDFK